MWKTLLFIIPFVNAYFRGVSFSKSLILGKVILFVPIHTYLLIGCFECLFCSSTAPLLVGTIADHIGLSKENGHIASTIELCYTHFLGSKWTQHSLGAALTPPLPSEGTKPTQVEYTTT